MTPVRNPWMVALLVLCGLLNGSCETARQVGKSIEGMIKSKPLDTKSLGKAMQRDTLVFAHKMEKLHDEFQKMLKKFKGEIAQSWGSEDIKVAGRTKYVKYTDEYATRAMVDFDRGKITVETLDNSDSAIRLKKALASTVLATSDPQSVDLFSDKKITLSEDRRPYLFGLVLDQEEQPMATQDQADKFADFAVRNLAKTRKGKGEKSNLLIKFVNLKMVNNFESKKAEQFRPFVKKYSEHYKVSPNLVLAIMKTESNFNPFAVSDAPAYGLMQLVPASGGREAYRRAKGEDALPSVDYLFDPENNIELGVAYLHVLQFNEMESVANAVSRDYCVIAAYNTGPGNVFKTFSKDRVSAIKIMNELDPGAMYDHLRSSLPYRETRQYLVKVVNNRKIFVSTFEDSL